MNRRSLHLETNNWIKRKEEGIILLVMSLRYILFPDIHSEDGHICFSLCFLELFYLVLMNVPI